MKLMTKAIEKTLLKHPFGSQDGKGNEAHVLVKFFGGYAYTALVTEAELQEDGDWLFYGIVTMGYEWEWGYFSLREIQSLRFPPFGLPAERDLYLAPNTKVKDLIY